jgi:hypothetical protein
MSLIKDFENKAHKLNYLFHVYPPIYPYAIILEFTPLGVAIVCVLNY